MRGKASKIVQAKKSILKTSDGISMSAGLGIKASASKEQGEVAKLEIGDKVYPVINTTLWFDSHEDVHLNGIWNKSISDGVKPALVLNHDYKIGQVISYPEDVVAMVKIIPWKDLGLDIEGETEALIFEATMTDDSNDVGFKAYRNRRKVQHSVRMEYVRISLAVNSDSEDWQEERKTYEKYINSIANKDQVEKNGYFWAVKEAKIYKEGSMVLEGSNGITPTLYEAVNYDTSEREPEKSTQKRLDLLNEIITLSKS
jgi:hypothetical protein